MSQTNELKAVVLAAGCETVGPGGRPLVLEKLGDRIVLDYVVRNALQVVRPDDLYIVVGSNRDEIAGQLGGAYHYVVQAQALGTAHAVMQVQPLLADYRGDLLILY
ncbi:MAG: bifunctional UDP-N-acetylglucosamine diphosphorylase/glucosamine-1-phosphate N-acetyltransferase GlmU, partial [Anaerolineae bacterium]